MLQHSINYWTDKKKMFRAIHINSLYTRAQSKRKPKYSISAMYIYSPNAKRIHLGGKLRVIMPNCKKSHYLE